MSEAIKKALNIADLNYNPATWNERHSTVEEAFTDLAAKDAEIARLTAERDAFKVALAKSDPWKQSNHVWMCQHCGCVYDLNGSKHKSGCVFAAALLERRP